MDMSNKTSDNTERLKQLAEELRESNEIKRFYGNNFTEGSKYCIISETELIPTAEAIEEVLAEREQKDKQIKELEEKLLDMIQGTEIINKETPEYVKENYIPKQAVMDELNRHKFAYEEFNKMYDNTHYEDDEKRASDFYMIVTEDRIVQVLQELLETK